MKRKMTWVIIAWTVLTVVLVAVSSGSQPECPATVANCDAYRAGANVGTGLAVTAILAAWFIGFIILSIVWFMTRPTKRLCPVCGQDAKKGQTVCTKCGHDFAAAGRTVVPSP